MSRPSKARGHLATTAAINRQIHAEGAAVVHVLASNEPAPLAHPPFSYTVGLPESFRFPELVVSGLGPDLEARVAMLVVQAHNTRNAAPMPDRTVRHPGLPPIVLKTVRPDLAAALLTLACERAGGAVPVAMQVVCADEHGLFPWDRGFSRKTPGSTWRLY